jgi:SLT domain-containing protein
MSAPFVGIALGAAAIAAVVAGVIALKSQMPAMATGGVVSSPTLALVGEGRYPEAVVPLGNSPQFSTMKEDIANAVLQGLSTISKTIQSKQNNSSNPIVLQIDGTNIARVLLPKINDEMIRGSRSRMEVQYV